MKLGEEIRKNNPFKVPEGYFDTLKERTINSIRERESSHQAGEPEIPASGTRHDETDADSSRRGARIIRMKPFLALAAAILGFAILAAAMVRLVSSGNRVTDYEPGKSLYADLAFEEVDTYMLENELIMTEPVTTEMKEEEISTEAIIDYLLMEDIDLNEIYELL